LMMKGKRRLDEKMGEEYWDMGEGETGRVLRNKRWGGEINQ
jgi:hypothetical protein